VTDVRGVISSARLYLYFYRYLDIIAHNVYNCVQVTWKRFDQVHPLTIGLYPFAPDTRIGVDYNQRMNEWSLIIQVDRSESN